MATLNFIPDATDLQIPITELKNTVVQATSPNQKLQASTVGNIRAAKICIPAQASVVGPVPMESLYVSLQPSQPVVLRGTAQVLAVNLGGVTLPGASMCYSVEWTEEAGS